MNLNRLAGLMILVILLSACSGANDGSQPSISYGHNTLESQPDPMKETIEKRCKEITSMYYDLYVSADKSEPQNQWDNPVLSQSSIDAIESLLMNAGLDVIDTNGVYPCHLSTADNFYRFWYDIEQDRSSEQEIIWILEDGALSYRLFVLQDGVTHVYSMRYPIDGNRNVSYEAHKVLEWKLTDKGNFYYRIYPAGDKHYSDYALIRMVEPDLELCDLTMKYIWAGGYVGTNIFLIDWTEDDFGDLSFNDLFESLYYDCNGKQFSPEGYEYIIEQDCCMIPAAEFEAVVRPYFDSIRTVAGFEYVILG